ncbi:MAG: hypothetical protein KC731_17445, partial [Myxococcales bacterium]|nr:hypothetical protein [Myxococcales bacterium]
GIDEDCDGLVDEVAAYCDAHLALESLSPWDAARALDLCHIAQGPKDWGLVDARWALPDGDLPPADLLVEYHLGHGLLDGFGPQVKVQRGERMLALSSGTARRPGDPNHHTSEGFRKGYTSGSPISGGTSPSCPDVVTGEPRDGVALEVVLRAPANVGSFSFDFDFYTHEWPTYICSPSNDYFVALMMPPPANLPGGNISLDAAGNPISVNTAFLDVCGCAANPPNVCMAGGKPFECVLGNGELVGTGYGADSGTGDHAATSWLTTTAPVEAGSEIKLRFTTYDSDDGDHDSLTL